MNHPISIIVAKSNDNIIGQDNDLPWRLKNDLKRFKELTTNNPIVMGRKTYESIGKPLPNRTNIVLTRDTNFTVRNPLVMVRYDTSSLLTLLDRLRLDNEIFIIGGGEIYNLFLPSVSKIYMTEVDTVLENGTKFPKLNLRQWIIEEQSPLFPADENHTYNYKFITYKRR